MNYKQLICDYQSLLDRVTILETKVFTIENECCNDDAGCITPSIVSQPSEITITEGEILNLSVQVRGTQPFTFQWSKDGEDIDGATNSSYIIPVATIEDSGDYVLTITNDCGEITSETVVIVVEEACTLPIITADPIDQDLNTGDTLTLTVSVTGDGPFTYQWKKEGFNILGETASTLTILDTTSANDGFYSVTVTNDCGSVTSTGAVVTVTDVLLTFYWGWKDDITAADNDVEVEALQMSDTFISGTDLTADFTANTDPKILIMAEPKTEPAKTRWFGSIFNQGTIGDPDTDLFGPTFETTSYRVYYTVYLTQQTDTPIQFQIS